MDLTHRFTVPTGIDQTWAHFQDIASVAQCFPGASVTSVDGDSFAGSVKVKLGPIALVYNGSGTFVEKDDTAHRFVVDAKGKDKRGNGTAGAKVTLTMASADGGATDVEVVTDLAITGKPAQFGRGVMQDVSDKLLGQFVACLEQRLSAESAQELPAQEPSSVPKSSEPDDQEQTPVPAEPPVSSAANVGTDEAAPPAPAPDSTTASTAPRGTTEPLRPVEADSDDALDLGTAVLPVLLKSYWKQLAGAGAVLAAVVWLTRRHR
ncbi:SRPBCC family protein [Branchiibius sp. NY16-3462-2]|uniref:SRPBCC family protein n=1 Tax=Branchiibius sp. NY16-3462-2 TaxID=1807500 RepID=UPI000799F927|nr:SRPBCC family protein [Branchiibius sp. NY16-3462-2]KYH43506.1 carbon monoxide dehydrogenase [Branchiibius sp. NY16-3462-2]